MDSGMTWNCEYVGSDIYDSGPTVWTYDGGSIGLGSSSRDCSEPGACSQGPGGGPRSARDPATSDDLAHCIPATDPNCEIPIPDTLQTQIRSALTSWLKDFNTIADTAKRARCKAMLDKFNSMFNAVPSQVFLGASDTPLTDTVAHSAAYDPATGHIHFDPSSVGGLAASSDKQWQIANSALHEAAHALGYGHAREKVYLPYRGLSPIYPTSEPNFSDLNPPADGGSCLKP